MNTENGYTTDCFNSDESTRNDTSQGYSVAHELKKLRRELKKLRRAQEEKTHRSQYDTLHLLRFLLAERLPNRGSAFGCDTAAMVRSLMSDGKKGKNWGLERLMQEELWR